MILGATDPFSNFLLEEFSPTAYKILYIIFVVILLYLFSYFNTKSKQELAENLNDENKNYIQNLKDYGSNLEELYHDVQVFHLEYLSRMDRLELAINSGDVNRVQEVYQSIIVTTNDYWDDKHYSISKLANIKISALKSLLSSKVIKAEKKGITVSVEAPDIIDKTPISRLDLLLMISVFCDNAIEEASLSDRKQITIACFTIENQQVFVVKNSTVKEKVDFTNIFKEGTFSKGKNRGVGLFNVQTILRRYPEVNLETKSEDFTFSQTLFIPEKVGKNE